MLSFKKSYLAACATSDPVLWRQADKERPMAPGKETSGLKSFGELKTILCLEDELLRKATGMG